MKFERVNQYLQTGANIGVILSILERACDP